jgi:protein-L-isoaspartate(D-aspartate) O-methyltransferase
MGRFVIIAIIIMLSSFQDEYTGARHAMVESQIAGRGVTNRLVLDAMRKVPRHQFVPDTYKSEAYQDRPLPIGMDQTISQPYIVGYMTEAISPGKDDIVLEIGTGSGYQAAVLAEIVKEVYTLEIVPELGKVAKDRLINMGYKNIHCRVSDGYHGWQEHAPFDAIVVTAAAEKIPQPLVDQLAEGGRMIIPVGPAFDIQNLVLLTRQNGEIKSKKLFSVRFVPFTRE